jgi:hypothetical protein
MIDSKIKSFMLQVQNLRLPYSEQQDIEEEIRNITQNNIGDIVSNALDKLSNLHDSEEALKNVIVVDRGGYPQLGSETGSFDFSSPPIQMLNRLLQNAKTSKSGDLYKVIPIGKSSENKPPQVIKNISLGVENMKAAPSMGDVTANMVSAFNSGAAQGETVRAEPSASSSATVFRTASSKQDAQTSWVIPEKIISLSMDVDSINQGIVTDIDNMMTELLSNKLRELEYVLRNA